MELAEPLPTLLKILLGEQPSSPEPIRAGLASSSPRCRAVALDLAGREVRELAPELIRLWFRDPAARPKIAAALATDPLLGFESRRPGLVAATEPGAQGPPVQQWFSPSRVQRILEALGAAAPQPTAELLELLGPLPGLHQQAAWASCSPYSSGARQQLLGALEAAEARRFPGSLAVAPSYRCDRGCSYCFVRDLTVRMKAELDLEGFRRALDVVCRDSPIRRVNLFGGEPTQFAPLGDFVRELEARRFSFYFSTIGVCAPAQLSPLLRSPSLEMVTLHLERPAAYTPGELDNLRENVRALGRASAQVVVRYNLVERELRDFGFLLPVLRGLPNAHFSFAVAFPSEARTNAHAGVGELERFAPKLLALVRFLDEQLPAGLPLVLAKPFPLCAFTAEQLRHLLGRVRFHNICEVHRRGFTDQALLNPDLTMSPCLALTAPKLSVPGPQPLGGLGAQFEAKLSGLMAQPPRPGCADCSLFRVGACQAACYAYVQ